MSANNCSICSRFLDNSADYLSLDCGGDCLGCIRVAEGHSVYLLCEHHNSMCVVPEWTLKYFEEYGQSFFLRDNSVANFCVEYLVNGSMSSLIQNSTLRKRVT